MISNFDDHFNTLIKSLNSNNNFILGLSGGIDSMALLHLIKNFIDNKIKGTVLGPVNAPIYRLNRKFRVRLLIRGIKSMKVQNSIARIIPNYKFSSGIKLSVDVDPINFN